jgi:HEAT repeat protein
VRLHAVRTIGELGGPADMPPLLDFFSAAKSSADIEAAEQALGSLCLKSADRDVSVNNLAKRLANAVPAQRAALLRILATAGGSTALGHVRSSLKDSSPEVRAAAIRALSSWSTPEAGPDLLGVARETSSNADKMVALRGFFALAKLNEVSEAQRLQMCRDAGELAGRPEEKRLLLAALGGINSVEAVAQIQPYLDDAAVKEEASTAVVGIAERLLGRNNSARFAPTLIQPLEKVAKTTTNAELAARAKKLVEQAKTKANQT